MRFCSSARTTQRYIVRGLDRQADVVFVGVAVFTALSVILTLAVKQLESHLASWRPETAKTF
jgi:ABC-type nitrate/sulfonate/bicarbonate transport system permease component